MPWRTSRCWTPALASGVTGRADHADHALGDARGAAPGLHPHCVGEGLPERSVILRHAIKNALIPVVSIIGLRSASILAGR